ncbi:MAG TPA: GNAT family protein [Candidatus Acidoferrales bacterium]|jgi:RimJ/RimL family protein N-acetyltransferase|nr:GNAT family protein [Candidatus Acidoferrales bacterium]
MTRPQPTTPQRTTLEGSYVQLVPLHPAAHAEALYQAAHGPGHEALWRYLFDGPYPTAEAFRAALEKKAGTDDPLFFAILDCPKGDCPNADGPNGRAVGYASFMRIEPAHRCIEVGSILYTPRLQRTAGATEAMYLMARHVFEDLGYRRYEWKCDSRNEPSRRAALRFGFTFEGIFRQHMIVKGQNRDTAWYAMLDIEWPERKARFERWLAPSNFDADGKQLTPLFPG